MHEDPHSGRLSIVLSLLFFVFANYKLPEWIPADIYLHLDPLLGLSAVLAGREIICPTGAAIDFFDPLFWHKKVHSSLKKDLIWRIVKFLFLILFLSSSVAGLTLVYLLDPLPFLTRFFQFLSLPAGHYPDKLF